MPKVFGMEPSTAQKLKPVLFIGGGGLLLFLLLKGRGQPTAVAADAPTGPVPPSGVLSPAVQPELAQSGLAVGALQMEQQHQQAQFDVAAGNLALKSKEQQLMYEGQAQQLEISNQREMNYYQQKFAHEELRNVQGRNKKWWQSAADIFATASSGFALFQGGGVVKTKNRAVQPPFYPTQTGRYPGT